MSIRRSDAAVATLLSLGSLAVAIPRAVAYPFFEDEVGTARVVSAHGPINLLKSVAADQTHPPGYFAALWAAHELGAPIVWERALSVFAVAIVAPAVFLYARRFLSLLGSAIAGAVVVFGWQFVRHGWELRPYSLLALVSLALVYVMEWAGDRPTLRRLWVVSSVVAVGSMTHYFFVFTVVAVVVWLLLAPIPARGRVVVALAIGLLPLVLWLPGFVKQYQHRRFETLGAFSPRRVLNLNADLLERSLPGGATGAVLAVVVVAVVAVGVIRLWADPLRGRLCACVAVLPFLLSAAVWLLGPHIFVPRNLIGSLPFVGVAIGAASTTRNRALEVALTTVVVALLAVGFVRARGRIVPDYDRVADALVAEGWHADDPILLFGPPYAYLHPLDWYLPGSDRLELAVPGDAGACRQFFIVAVGGQARVLTSTLDQPARHVASIVIGRMPSRPDIWRQVSARRGYVLGTRRSPCLRFSAA